MLKLIKSTAVAKKFMMLKLLFLLFLASFRSQGRGAGAESTRHLISNNIPIKKPYEKFSVLKKGIDTLLLFEDMCRIREY